MRAFSRADIWLMKASPSTGVDSRTSNAGDGGGSKLPKSVAGPLSLGLSGVDKSDVGGSEVVASVFSSPASISSFSGAGSASSVFGSGDGGKSAPGGPNGSGCASDEIADTVFAETETTRYSTCLGSSPSSSCMLFNRSSTLSVESAASISLMIPVTIGLTSTRPGRAMASSTSPGRDVRRAILPWPLRGQPERGSLQRWVSLPPCRCSCRGRRGRLVRGFVAASTSHEGKHQTTQQEPSKWLDHYKPFDVVGRMFEVGAPSTRCESTCEG